MSGTTITSTLHYTNVYLSVTYHMPNSILTLDPSSSVEADANLTAHIQSESSAYTHLLAFAIGAHNNYVDVAAGVDTAAFSFPMEWLDAIPDKTSVTGTVNLYTYDGETLLGQDTKHVTVMVPTSATPAITSIAVTRIDGAVPASWGKYVQGKSKVRLDIAAAGVYGSTIRAVSVSGAAAGGAVLSNGVWSFTSPFLATSGSNVFTVTVVDSREKSSQDNSTAITVYPYFLPRISNPKIQRCLEDKTPSDSGTNLLVYGTLSHADVGGSNTASAVAQFRQMPSGDWSEPVDVASEEAKAIGDNGVSTTNSYQARIVLTDTFTSTEFVEDIATAGAMMDFFVNGTQQGISLFGMADKDGLEVKGDKEIRYKSQTLDERFAVLSHTHTPSGIGAATASHTHTPASIGAPGLGTLNGSEDFNNIVEPGMYRINGTPANMPAGAGSWGQLLVVRGGADIVIQMYFPWDASRPTPWVRGMAPTALGGGGTVGPWVRVYAEDRITHGTGNPSGGNSGDIYLKHT